jgi:glycosyltransferase involved in cell wall biosynthesis
MKPAGNKKLDGVSDSDNQLLPTLTVVILTFNEEVHIERSIASVASIASDILVVDSFSNDRTVELATNAGARVLQNAFVNYSKQFQWALDNGGVSSEWIIRLDADEVIEPDLAAEIEKKLPAMPADVVAVNFKRKHIFMGRWIKHGGRYPLILLRMWRNGQGRIEDRWMDEHIVTWGGRVITMQGGFSDICLRDLTFFTDKHNRYATREAIDVLSKRYGLFSSKEQNSLGSRQADIKRAIKERFYNQLPSFVAPTGLFIYRYVFQLGFLDGREGLIYHFLQGYWYRFLITAKIIEFESAMANCTTKEQRAERLSELTGHKLRP